MIEKPILTSRLKYLMATGCGVVVANMYYCQPLLGAFSRAFQITEEAASFVNICSQIGYGLGLFFIVPLGDMIARRKLLLWMIFLSAVSVTGMAFSTNLSELYIFSVSIGITSTACQVFIPLAVHLTDDEERGKTLGIMLGGLLTGILLSRSLSGFVAEYFGWETVYFIAAGFMLVLIILVWKMIPGEEPAFSGSYSKLMRSLFQLFKQQPVIRESSVIGASLFGAISAFWATMAFFLEKPPFQYSLTVIGLFGIIGAGGALISPFVGRISDRYGPFKPMRAGILMMLIGYLVLFEGRFHIGLVIAGIILIDMGLQSTHIPNLARNYAIMPEARTRLNTIYMTFFFIGGTIGSTLGSIAWNAFEWSGVCIVGIVFVLVGAIPVYFIKRKEILAAGK